MTLSTEFTKSCLACFCFLKLKRWRGKITKRLKNQTKITIQIIFVRNWFVWKKNSIQSIYTVQNWLNNAVMFCIFFAKVVKLFPNILPHMDNLSVLYCKRNPISPPHRNFLIQGSATPIFSWKAISTLRQSNDSSNQFISRNF